MRPSRAPYEPLGPFVGASAAHGSRHSRCGSKQTRRTFHWRKGQRHYPGTYWSYTTRSHVIYESRLELARLLCADFEPSVHGIDPPTRKLPAPTVNRGWLAEDPAPALPVLLSAHAA
ncbi:hypothetical protein GCM10014715_64570 [Streptomyces spiralis]|uniref:Uncharacterized protein n=1 Tax=Streptomyces spiralis TaxID=66376 RepID=A0A919DYU3_9ACTN|nr:hypothetical protein GCM10014715_64570 [Streptomyces spiralis]